MPTSPSGRYAGASADERRAARRERLLDAGLRLLGDDGARGTTVRAVCDEAGLNSRYFYESFDDLDGLLVAVFDRLADGLTAHVLDAYAAAADDIGAKSRATVGALVTYLTDDPRRARVAFVEALGSEALARRRLDRMHEVAGLVVVTARTFAGVPEDRDPIAEVSASMLVGGVAELLIAWLDGRLADVTREQLVEDVAALWVATGESAMAIARARARAGGRGGPPDQPGPVNVDSHGTSTG